MSKCTMCLYKGLCADIEQEWSCEQVVEYVHRKQEEMRNPVKSVEYEQKGPESLSGLLKKMQNGGGKGTTNGNNGD